MQRTRQFSSNDMTEETGTHGSELGGRYSCMGCAGWLACLRCKKAEEEGGGGGNKKFYYVVRGKNKMGETSFLAI
jgi:hypothetical protein